VNKYDGDDDDIPGYSGERITEIGRQTTNQVIAKHIQAYDVALLTDSI